MYRLDSEQQAIVDKVREIADEHIGPNADRVDTEGVFPEASIEALGREGFLGLTVSPEFGGMGQSVRVMCAVLDEIAQRCASTGMIYLMHLCGVACYSAVPNKTADQLRASTRRR